MIDIAKITLSVQDDATAAINAHRSSVDSLDRSYLNVAGDIDTFGEATGNADVAAQKLLRSLRDEVATFGMTRAEMQAYQARMLGVGKEADDLIRRLQRMKDAQAAYGGGLKATSQDLDDFGRSAQQTAHAMRMVPAQLTDIVTQLAGGQNPILVLIQQGGQLRDIFGGFRPMFQGLAAMISPVSLAVAGVGAAIAGLGYAAYEGHQQSALLNRTLALTGNYAGVTEDQILSLSRTLGKVEQSGIGAARDSLQGLIATGQFTGDILESAGTAALVMAKYSGKSASDVITHFAAMSDGVAKWAEENNKQYHFLSVAQYERIRNLEEEGKKTEAMRATFTAFTDSMPKQTENLGYLEQAWRGVGNAVSSVWQGMLAIGRTQTVGDKLQQVRQHIANAEAELKTSSSDVGNRAVQNRINDLRQQEAELQELQRLGVKGAEIQSQIAQNQQAGIDASNYFKRLDDEKKSRGRVNQALEDNRRATLAYNNSHPDSPRTAEQIAEDEAFLRKKHGEKSRTANPEAIGNRDVASIRAQIAEQELLTASLQKYGLQADKITAGEKKMMEIEQQLGLAQKDRIGKVSDAALQAQLVEARRLADAEKVNVAFRDRLEIQGRVTAEITKWENATKAEQALLEQDIALTGQSAEARKIAAAQLKVEAELRDFLAVQARENKTLMPDEIAQLIFEAEARKRNIAAIMGESQARAGATQLLQENKRFAAEAIIDERARSSALLEIDAETWRERIRLAGEGTDAQRLLQQQFDVWYANRQMTPVINQWRHVVDQLDTDFHEGFRDMLTHGKAEGAWKTFTKALGNTFKTSLADALYQTFIKRYVLQAVVNTAGVVSGEGVAGALSGGSSMLSTASSAYSMYNNAGNLYNAAAGFLGVGGTAMGVAGATGVTAATAGTATGLSLVGTGTGLGLTAGGGTGLALGTAGTAAATGTAGAITGAGAAASTTATAGIGSVLAAIPVWGWAALAAAAVIGLSQDGPEDHTALRFTSNNTPGNISINRRGNEGKDDTYIGPVANSAFGTFGVDETFWMEPRQQIVEAFVKSIEASDDLLAKYMSDAEKANVKAYVTGRTSQAETGPEGNDPSAGLATVYTDRIRNVLEGVEGSLSRFVEGFGGTAQDLTAEAATILDVRKNLSTYSITFGEAISLDAIAAAKVAGESFSGAMNRLTSDFNVTNAVAAALGQSAVTAFDAVGLASTGARERLIALAGGVDALLSKTQFFSENFLTEAERMAPTIADVQRIMGNLGYASVDTRDKFKQLVQGLNLGTEAGANLYAQLMNVAPAFAQVATYREQIDQRAMALSSQRSDLEIQIMELQGDATGALAAQRQIELAGMDESLRPLMQRIYALQDEATAAQSAAQALEQHNAFMAQVEEKSKQQASSMTSIADDQTRVWSDFGMALTDAMDQAAQRTDAFIQSINEFKSSLYLDKNLSALSPEEQYNRAQAALINAQGDDIRTAAQQFLEASRAYYGSSEGYAADFKLVLGRLDSSVVEAQQRLEASYSFGQRAAQMIWSAMGVADADYSDYESLSDYASGGSAAEVVMPAVQAPASNSDTAAAKETAAAMARSADAIERQNALLEDLIEQVEAGTELSSEDMRGLKQYLGAVISKGK